MATELEMQVTANTESIAALKRYVEERITVEGTAALSGKVATNEENIELLKQILETIKPTDIPDLSGQVETNRVDIEEINRKLTKLESDVDDVLTMISGVLGGAS